jgi:hypothetical protein
MQASSTPYHDSVDHAYGSQKTTTSALQPPSRLAPSPAPSTSHFPSPEAEEAQYRLPRTSSLLPPPRLVPNSNSGAKPAPSSRYSPVAEGHTSTTTNTFSPFQSNRHEPDEVRSSSRASAANSHYVNRWSVSTGSSHSNTRPPSGATPANRRTSSIDTTFLLTSSPPSAKRRSRKLQKTHQPSETSEFLSSLATATPNPVRSPSRRPARTLRWSRTRAGNSRCCLAALSNGDDP